MGLEPASAQLGAHMDTSLVSTIGVESVTVNIKATQNIEEQSWLEIYPMLGHNGSVPLRRKLLWAWPYFSWNALKFGKLGWMRLLYTDNYGASLGVIAFSSVASVLVDTFTDPAMSNVTDQFRSKYGRRRPFIFFSAFYTPLVFILSFAPPGSGAVASIWFGVFHIAFKLADTVFGLSNDAWGTELSPSSAERSNVWAWRYFFTPTGILFGMVALGKTYPSGLYMVPVLFFSAIHFQGCLTLACFGKERSMSTLIPPPKSTGGGQRCDRFSTGDVIPSLMCTMMNQPFWILLLTAIARGFGQEVPYAILAYMTRWVIGEKCANFGSSDLMVYAVILNTLGSLIFIRPWLWLATKTSKYAAYFCHLVLMALSSAMFVFLDLDSGDCTMNYATLVLAFFWGVALSGQFILQGMVNDVIDYDEFLSGGCRREACYVMSIEFFPKMAAIPGEFVPIVLMAYMGYRRPLLQDPGPPSCGDGPGQDAFCSAFYRDVTSSSSCSDEMTCVEYLSNGAEIVCNAATAQCGVVQNDNVRLILRCSFALIPCFFYLLACFALLRYPKVVRQETQHQELLQSMSRLRRGETVEDPWNPGVFVSPSKPDGPRSGALSYFWPSELRNALAAAHASQDGYAADCVWTLLRRPLRLALLSAPLIPAGTAIIAWGWEDMFDSLGASVSPLGLVLLGCGILGVWFHGERARAAQALGECEVTRKEIAAAFNKMQPFAGGAVLNLDAPGGGAGPSAGA